MWNVNFTLKVEAGIILRLHSFHLKQQQKLLYISQFPLLWRKRWVNGVRCDFNLIFFIFFNRNEEQIFSELTTYIELSKYFQRLSYEGDGYFALIPISFKLKVKHRSVICINRNIQRVGTFAEPFSSFSTRQFFQKHCFHASGPKMRTILDFWTTCFGFSTSVEFAYLNRRQLPKLVAQKHSREFAITKWFPHVMN